jgi:hypothetical protein
VVLFPFTINRVRNINKDMTRPHSKLDDLTKEERQELILRLHKRQNGKCFICDHEINLKLDPVDIDHIVSISPPFNGIDDEQNWGLVHRKENESKSNRSLQLMRYIYSYRALRDKFVNEKGDFTVGDALETLVPEKQDIFLDSEPNFVTISYVGDDGLSKKEKFRIDEEEGIVSFVGMFPFSWIQHDKSINPRSIADLEPMIEEFYNRYPQLQPSLGHMEVSRPSQPSKIMLFDGQHKAAAQLFNHKGRLLVRVFLNTDLLLLKTTNFRAHTVLAQIHFPDIVEDKVGRDLFKEAFDVYVTQTDMDIGSEEKFLNSFEQGPDYREHLKRYVKYESLFSEGQHKILNYVETVWARSKKYPLVYDTLDKTFFRFFLYLNPSTEHLRESQKYRKIERENLSRLMTVFAEEILDRRFDVNKGIFKMEQRLMDNPDSIANDHLAAYRICRAAPMVVWTEQLKKAIVLLLRSHPGYFKDEWSDKRPLWIEIAEERWEKIRKMFKVIREHQIWIEKNQPTVIGAISSTRQKDWKEILLNGRLPGRVEQLYSPLTYTKIHEIAIS